MDIQLLVAGVIIVLAFYFVGSGIWKKVRSFSTKNESCDSDCGCSGKAAKS